MTTATDMLAAYLAAETAILLGKEVRFQERWVKMEDLEWVQKGRREWESKVATEAAATAQVPTAGGGRFKLANFANAQ